MRRRAGKWRTIGWRLLALAGVLSAGAAGHAGASPPERIVSINICGDLLAMSLAPRARIASVTFLAADPIMSPMAGDTGELLLNYGKAEEVLALEPDLVLAGRYTTRATVALLRRLGYRVVELDIAYSLDDVRRQIRTAAAAMQVEPAGEAMITDLDARIAASTWPGQGPRPLAVVYGPNGFTPGPRTLSGALLELAGFDNLAARAGIQFWGSLPLEDLLLARPELLVIEAEHGRHSLATGILGHPALERLRAAATVTRVARPLWSCPGPWIADALDQLAAAHAAMQSRTPR